MPDEIPTSPESQSETLPVKDWFGGKRWTKGRTKPDGSLTDREQLFVAEYLIDFNGTKSAIRAGYSPNSAAVTASQLLRKPNIKAEMDRQYSKIYDSLSTRARRVIEELVRISFSDVRELFDEKGNLLPIPDLPDSIAPAISSVEVVKRYSDEETSEYVTKIRLWDKTKALQMLGKHLGILRDIVEHTGKDGGPIKLEETVTIDPDSLSPEAREVLWKEVQKARAGKLLEPGESD